MLGIAAYSGSSIPRFADVAEPREPTAGEVLCRTLELGVCGTDREILLSERPWLPQGSEFLVLGHECLARIEQVGPGVSDFKNGDLVVPAVRRPFAGQTRRLDLLPFGTFTERGIVQEHGFSVPWFLDRPEHLYRVDPSIADVAVLTEPLAVAEKGANEALVLQRARLSPEVWSTDQPPRVLVTGQGPIAFAAVLACVARGWLVTMAGRDDAATFRSQLAQRLGANYLSLRQQTLPSDDIETHGFDLVLECTGSDELTLSAAAALRSCGVMVWLGSSRMPEARTHNVERLMRDGLLRNQLFVGSVNAAPRDFHAALAHLAWWRERDRSTLKKLITARVNQAEALWHYQHREPQGIKTVVQPG